MGISGCTLPLVTTRLDGYIRVSRVRGREGDSFISPSVQRDQIAGWARLRGVEIADWHTDLDETGGKLDRPGLDEALRRIEVGQTGGIAVARLDRLSRAGVADALRLVEEIHDRGAKLAVIDLGVDPTTAFGEFAMTVMLALARMERRRVQETWRTARELAVARGVHISSAAPTGYIRGNDGVLQPHPEYAPIIRRLFEGRATGKSWTMLARELEDHRVEGPYGPLEWMTRAPAHIIANRVYLGEARSGDIVNTNAHEPLVDRATWEAAQGSGLTASRTGQPALLAGLLRCAGCRHPLKADKMTDSKGERLRTYRCRIHHAGGRCNDRSSALGRVVEPWVEQQFFARIEQLSADAVEDDGALDDAMAALSRAEAELAAYRDETRIVSIIGQESFLEGLSARMRVVDDALSALALARASALPSGLPAQDLRELWPSMDAEEKRLALRAVIDAVMLRSGRNVPIERRALVLWRGEAPDDFPRRGRKRVPIIPFNWPDLPPDPGVPSGEY